MQKKVFWSHSALPNPDGLVPVQNDLAQLVAESANDDENQVDDDPNAKTAQGHDHQNAGADLAHIKTMDS